MTEQIVGYTGAMRAYARAIRELGETTARPLEYHVSVIASTFRAEVSEGTRDGRPIPIFADSVAAIDASLERLAASARAMRADANTKAEAIELAADEMDACRISAIDHHDA